MSKASPMTTSAMAPRHYSLHSRLLRGLSLLSASLAIVTRSSCLSCAVWMPVFPPNWMSTWTITPPTSIPRCALVLAESGGTLVRSDYAAGYPAGLLPQRQGTGAKDRRFRAALQPKTTTLCLDGDSGFDPCKDRPTLFTYFRDATLVCAVSCHPTGCAQ